MAMNGCNSSIRQTFVLQFVGFLPLPSHQLKVAPQTVNWSKVSTLAPASPAILLLIGTFYFTYIQGAMSYHEIFIFTPTNPHTNPLLSAMVDLPYGVINLRRLVVLAVFFYKRHSWCELSQQTQELLHLARTATAAGQFSRKTTLLSGFLLTVTALGHVTWELAEWYYFWSPGDPSDNLPVFSAVSVVPVPNDTYEWPYITLYICFSFVPFILSQQVYGCAMVLASIVGCVLTAMEQDMLRVCRQWMDPVHRSSLNDLARKVAKWEYLHSQALLVVEAMNRFFGEIFLFTYFLGVMVAVSYAGSFIVETDRSLMFYCVSIGGFALFSAYAMFLPLPFVLVHNQGYSLADTIHALTNRFSENSPVAGPGILARRFDLLNALDGFQDASRNYACLLTGLDIVSFTRAIIIGVSIRCSINEAEKLTAPAAIQRAEYVFVK
ncbi:hypothetical protein BV898_05436 [Hypsibius exemplaris]|uniref:Odorant receptor n=1 Tax=Hypsibius exemplaris TaxID=2072580 RepID=A0A1W0WZI0_HYPEX|nr:hypothetical protein BV898_05436 [Hypsibius exemplaris]